MAADGSWQPRHLPVYGTVSRRTRLCGFSIDYRLTRDGQNHYPAAVHDVRAAVQWVRSHGAELKIDPARIALMGDSAGAHLGALVALAGDTTDSPCLSR